MRLVLFLGVSAYSGSLSDTAAYGDCHFGFLLTLKHCQRVGLRAGALIFASTPLQMEHADLVVLTARWASSRCAGASRRLGSTE